MTDWGAVIDATWPAANLSQAGPFTLRDTPDGGKRVNAATGPADGRVTPEAIAAASAEMRRQGRDPLFRLHAGRDDPLDAMLVAAGFDAIDATSIRACPIAALCQDPVPPVTAFTVWPPLAAQRDIWTAAGVGAARQAVMDRVTGPKTTLLGRIDDRPAATLFVAIHGGIAMLHALDVAPPYRRRGLAGHLTRAAARWAQAQGATTFSLLVTRDNAGANALYERLGLTEVGSYHYRILRGAA